MWLIGEFLCGGASIETSVGRLSLPKLSPIWNWMSYSAKFGDINAMYNKSVLPFDLSMCDHQCLSK